MSMQKIRRRGKEVPMTSEQRAEILRLSRIGHSIAKISDLTPFSRWTVHKTIKEARGERIVQRERNRSEASSVEAPVGTEIMRPREVKSDIVDGAHVVGTAAEVAARLIAAVDEARRSVHQMEDYTRELEELWERAERVSQMEDGFNEALSTFEVLKQRMDEYKRRLEEFEAKNVERAMVVHSKGSLLRD